MIIQNVVPTHNIRSQTLQEHGVYLPLNEYNPKFKSIKDFIINEYSLFGVQSPFICVIYRFFKKNAWRLVYFRHFLLIFIRKNQKVWKNSVLGYFF